jgi:hypothetical protein
MAAASTKYAFDRWMAKGIVNVEPQLEFVWAGARKDRLSSSACFESSELLEKTVPV